MVKTRAQAARGLAYLGLLYMVALAGIAGLATQQLSSLVQRRQAEEELLFIGHQFRQALKSYVEATPAGSAERLPRQLQDLLLDPRQPFVRRHLRRLPPDPVTGASDWVLLRGDEGRIVGLHSASTREPIRQDHFAADDFHFKGQRRHADWWFVWGVVCTDQGCALPGRALPSSSTENR
jgi:type II secretory pathway pseudopilin PulG